ncbi:uncharacterized protein [Nicotiana tomentosiformis]|uniref:uncharacterized protein n=1 Tax=Nicotiana tomentosiformis TaxID=4098 RepID=UPI00388C5A3D
MHFMFRLRKSSSKLTLVACRDVSCPWKLRAVKYESSDRFYITKYHGEHTCGVQHISSCYPNTSSKTLGAYYQERYVNGKGPSPSDLKDAIFVDFNQNLTYWRSWKVGEIAKAMIRGTHEEGYALLEAYRHVMMAYNEGSIVDLKVDHKLNFRYFFLSVGAFIKGITYMRKVIEVDGTFLSGRYGGCLLSAVAQDIKNHIFPIALCVVDKECDASWTYFFEQLRHIADNSDELCIISNRYLSIGNGFKKNLLSLIIVFARITLMKICARGNRYDVLTTNIAESLSAMLKDQRDFPIIGLFNHIIRKFAEKFEERRNEMKSVLTLFVPYVEKNIRNNMVVGDTLRVHQLENNQFGVVGHNKDALVDLDLNACSCCQFDLEKIPRPHAMVALRLSFGDGYGSSIYDHPSPFYKISTYLVAYEGTIHANPTEEK